MTSLAFASQGDCEAHSPESRHLKRRVASLQSEVEILSRIIRMNEATLEEINDLIFQQLENAKMITTHEIMCQHNRSQFNNTKTSPLEQQIHQEIADKISKLVACYHINFLKVYEGIVNQHHVSLDKLKKQLREEGGKIRDKATSERGDCDTSIEEHTTGKAIFEIPIEVQLLKEVVDSDVQVNLFSSSKSLIYEVPIEMHEIFEVPMELNQIFEVPVELNVHEVEKHKVFEIPMEMDEVFQVPVELDMLDEDGRIKNIIFETPVFTSSQKVDANVYEQENIKLKEDISKLLEELNQLKELNETTKRQIYEVPVQLEPFGETELNNSQCEVYLPEIQIESQNDLNKPQIPSKYDSIKNASSKISTQINTQPDLDLSPVKERNAQKNSIILSGATPIQESLTYVVSTRPASSEKNINFFISEKQLSRVESVLDESNEVTQKMGSMPGQTETIGKKVEIEMQTAQEIIKCEQSIQTDAQEPTKKDRIAKIPMVKVIQVPYEVQKIVEKFVKIPVLKVVQIPIEVDTPKTAQKKQEEEKITSLNSANKVEIIERIVEVPKLIVVEVPVQVVIEKVVVKEVPIEVIIEKQLPAKTIVKEVPIEVCVELPQKTIVKELPIEVIVEKEVIVQKEVIVEKLIQVPKVVLKEVPLEVIIQKEIVVERLIQVPKTVLRQVPVEVIIEKEVIVQKQIIVEKETVIEKLMSTPPQVIVKEVPVQVIVEKEVIIQKTVEMPAKTIIRQVPVEVIVEREVIIQKIVELPQKTLIKEVPIEVFIQKEVIVEKIIELPAKTIIKQVPVEVLVLNKVIELPAKTIIRQVPIEVIVERIVELPARTIIKEVPVEVIVEKEVEKIVEVIVEKTVIHEVPVEVIVEKIVEVKTVQIRQVPVEVLVEREVPIEVIRQKQVYVTKIQQVPVEVIVEKIVEIPVIVEVPVEVFIEKKVPIVKEIPYEVVIIQQVERIVQVPVQLIREVPVEVIVEVEKILIQQVEKIVEVPVQLIREVPVEVIVEVENVQQVIKIVKELVEVPVVIYMQAEKNEVQEKEIVISTLEQESEEKIFKKLNTVQVPKSEEPASHNLLLQSNYPVENEEYLPTIVELPVEVIIQKEVVKIVQRIVEVPVEVVIQKEVVKIVHIQRIVEVPVQVIVEKEVIRQQTEILEMPVEIITAEEIPIDLIEIVEMPVQVIIEKETIAHQTQIVELPVQVIIEKETIVNETQIVEMPVQVIIQKEVVKIREVPVELLTQIIKQVPVIAEIPTEIIVVEERQKIIYVPQERIVEVPIEVIIEKPIYIEKIVEVPVEVVIEKEVIVKQTQIVEVPVEIYITKEVIVNHTQVVEVPVEVVIYKDRLIEVPVELIVEKEVPVQVEKIKEVPVEVLVDSEDNEIRNEEQDVIKGEIEQQQQPVQVLASNEFTTSQVVKMTPINQQQQGDYEIIYEVPADIRSDGQEFICDIDATNLIHKNMQQIIITIPYNQFRPDQANNQAQTDSFITSNELEAESKATSQIKKLNSRQYQNEIIMEEIGIQTIQQGEKVRVIELPIEVENINYEKVQKETQHKYRDYLADLKQRFGKEINELNSNVVNLQSIILESNAEKELLREKIETDALREQSLLKELQFLEKQKESASEGLKRQLEALKSEMVAKSEMIDQLNGEIEELNGDISNLHESMHKVHEVPVVMETINNRIFQVMVEIQPCKQTSDQVIQTDDIELVLPDILEIPIELQLKETLNEIQLEQVDIQQIPQEQFIEKANKLNQIDINASQIMDEQCQTQEKNNQIYEVPIEVNIVKDSISLEIQTDFTVKLTEDIVLVREVAKNPYDIIEIPTETIGPIIYEIATQIALIKDTEEAEAQTEMEIEPQVRNDQESSSQANQVEMHITPEMNSNASEQSSNSEEEKQKQQEDEEEEEEEFQVQTEKTFKHKHQMSQGSFFKKKKPYSEYFTSRIFEIPVEVNVNKEDIHLKALLSTEVQTQASEIDAGLSTIFLSRQRELTVSHMRIVPAFEPLKVISEAIATPAKRSPDRKIFRFGSENDTLGANANFSNVQSLTPNQLDGSSSYDKFPMPTININNISLIKKSSIHSEGKFFGSLDMREELLSHDNHEQALASVRMANRKLAGFEQGESSSEEGDIHNLSREMIIEENETIISRDINRIQTPNLEPHDLNFSEYATLKEKMYECDEEKVNYQELYDNAQTELEGLRQKLYYKSEELSELKVQIDKESCKYEEEIRKIGEELQAAQKMVLEQEANVESQKARANELQDVKVKLEKKIEMLFQNWEKLKDENEKNEITSGKEFERLRGIISEKISQIKELRADEHHQKEVFEAQIHEYRDVITKKREIIEQLEEELQRRSDRIDQLTDNLEEMRKNINNHNNELDTAAIYEQEFERVKQVFEDEKRQLNYKLYDLKEQNHQLRETLAEEVRKREELQATVAELEREVKQAKHDYSNLHHLKSELENNFMEGVKCLNQELEEMKDLVREKDEIIHNYQPTLASSPPQQERSSIEQTLSKFRIEYISKQASLVAPEGTKQLEAYCRKLENLLKKYQRIIIENQGTIEELQDKVYEYLKDALEKQQQAQGLYMKLVDYENTINNILVQKVTLDIENKRLIKQIELSQKKLNVLGNRLIQVARNRAQYESDDDYYYD